MHIISAVLKKKDQTAAQAALDEVAFETGLHLSKEQLIAGPVGTQPNRDPRGWILSIPFAAFVPASDLKDLNQTYQPQCFDLDKLPALAFDHLKIIQSLSRFISSSAQTEDKAYQMLPSSFTLKQARVIYTTFAKKEISLSNFKKVFVAHRELFVKIGQATVKDGPGHPMDTYRNA